MTSDAFALRALQDHAGERIACDEAWQSRSNANATTMNIFLDHTIARTDAVIAGCFSGIAVGDPSRNPNDVADELANDARFLLRDLCELWRGDAFHTASFHRHVGSVLFPEVSDLDDWLSTLNTRVQLTGR